MFLAPVNTVCNLTVFTPATMGFMGEAIHESAERLYTAAKRFASVEGKSAVARLLNESPQVVNNWERRGVSEGGALKAQAAIGCDAIWLLTGKGSPDLGWPFPRVPLAVVLALEPENRAYIEGVLATELDRLSTQPSAADVEAFRASHIRMTRPVKKRNAA